MKRVLIGLIAWYRRWLSLDHGWLGGIIPHQGRICRYDPSCSEYAMTAIERYGVVKGGWLAVKRVARCQPRGGSGWDPVPD